jgi:predicted lipid carrier protein YhbT
VPRRYGKEWKVQPPAGVTEAFLRDLNLLGFEPSLAKTRGSVRVTVADASQPRSWLVRVDRGRVSVSQDDAPAECAVRGTGTLLDAILGGETNPVAAYLRGELDVEGNLELVVLFQRLLPSPTGRGQPPGGPIDG